MSVLLEALKKAAEDKKKALAGTVDSNNEVGREPEKTVKNQKLNKIEPATDFQKKPEKNEVKIKLSLDSIKSPSELESIKTPKDKAPLSSTEKRSVQEASQATLSLKLDSGLPKQKDLKTTSHSEQTENITKSTTSTLKLAIEDSVSTEPEQSRKATIAEKSKRVEKELSTSLSESQRINVEPSSKQDLSGSANKQELSKTPALKEKGALISTQIESSPLEKVVDESIILPHDIVEDKVFLKAELLDLEDGLTKTTNSKLAKNDIAESVSANLEKQQLKEDEDSYKWSLDALPGYLGFGKKKQKKNKRRSEKPLNPILVAGALSEERPKEKSFKFVLILLIFLLMIGIFFYGILYYQEQYENLEQRMNKYNLVKTQILVKEVNKVDKNNNENVAMVNSGVIDTALDQKGLDSAETASNVGSVDNNSPIKRDLQNVVSVTESIEPSVIKPVSKVLSKGQVAVVKSTKEDNFKSPKIKSSNESYSNTQSSNDSLKNIQNRAKNKAIVVVHSEEDVLLDAYSNYEKGDLVQAQAIFKSVLAMNPQNEFALIGLGNILVSKQQYFDAMAYYQQALVARPSSLNAFEAIANVSGHVELNSDWKNALLAMVKDYPNSPTLQYALGNLYAMEKDWLAAQESYFQAASLEPDNADYLVNLAVSLDQLGKYKPAARYYTEALAFTEVESVNFNEAQVKNRLITIRQFMAERKQ